ncbi:MAG: PmbA/TldA family metallopeptidase, partial [Terriglobia bacterium]
MAQDQLEQIASDLVGRAMRAGATAADVIIREREEFSAVIRMRQIESLKEAATKALGLRAFMGTRSASAYSQDFSPHALERLVARTLAMAQATSEDPASILG